MLRIAPEWRPKSSTHVFCPSPHLFFRLAPRRLCG
jgi:hypothetical protein